MRRPSVTILLLVVGCGKSANAPPPGEPDPEPKVAAPEIAVIETALAETDEYTLALGTPATPGQSVGTMFQLSVTAKKGWKVNTDYPAKLAIAPPADCAIAKPTQRRDDAIELKKTRATWRFDYSSCAPKAPLAGDLKFAVCTDKTCVEKKEKVAIALPAK
jgi:hypothetical protein